MQLCGPCGVRIVQPLRSRFPPSSLVCESSLSLCPFQCNGSCVWKKQKTGSTASRKGMLAKGVFIRFAALIQYTSRRSAWMLLPFSAEICFRLLPNPALAVFLVGGRAFQPNQQRLELITLPSFPLRLRE